jgi:hypothetical protein
MLMGAQHRTHLSGLSRTALGFIDIGSQTIPQPITSVNAAMQVIIGDNLWLAGEIDSNEYVNMGNAAGEFYSIIDAADANNPGKLNAAANLIAHKYITATYTGPRQNCAQKVVDVPGGKSAATHCAQYNAIVSGQGLDFVNIANGGDGLNYTPTYFGSFPASDNQSGGSRAGTSPGDATGSYYPGAITPTTQKLIDSQVANYATVACGSPNANNTASYDPNTGAVKVNCKWFINLPFTMNDVQALSNADLMRQNYQQALALQGSGGGNMTPLVPSYPIQDHYAPPTYATYATPGTPPPTSVQPGTTAARLLSDGTSNSTMPSSSVSPVDSSGVPQIRTDSGQQPQPQSIFQYFLGPPTPAPSGSSSTAAASPISGITDWITANPLLAASIAVGAYMLLGKK